jgi:hypothetical protein
MSEITDAMNRLAAQPNRPTAAQATSFHNLDAALSDLKATKLTPVQQEIVKQLEKSLATIGMEAKEPEPEEDEDDEVVQEPPAAETDETAGH